MDTSFGSSLGQNGPGPAWIARAAATAVTAGWWRRCRGVAPGGARARVCGGPILVGWGSWVGMHWAWSGGVAGHLVGTGTGGLELGGQETRIIQGPGLPRRACRAGSWVYILPHCRQTPCHRRAPALCPNDPMTLHESNDTIQSRRIYGSWMVENSKQNAGFFLWLRRKGKSSSSSIPGHKVRAWEECGVGVWCMYEHVLALSGVCSPSADVSCVSARCLWSVHTSSAHLRCLLVA